MKMSLHAWFDHLEELSFSYRQKSFQKVLCTWENQVHIPSENVTETLEYLGTHRHGEIVFVLFLLVLVSMQCKSIADLCQIVCCDGLNLSILILVLAIYITQFYSVRVKYPLDPSSKRHHHW